MPRPFVSWIWTLSALTASGLGLLACSSDPDSARGAGSDAGAGAALSHAGDKGSSGTPGQPHGGAANASTGAAGGARTGSGGTGEGGEDTGSDSEAGHGGVPEGSGGTPPVAYTCPSDSNPEPPASLFASDCNPTMSWGPGEPALADGSDLDQLIAVTPDERTMVWFDARGSTGTYRLADRSSSDQPFGPASVLDVTNVLAASSDGLRLIALRADTNSLAEYTRAARGEAFGAAEEGAFGSLNSDAAENGYTFLDALVSPDERELYYNTLSSEALSYSLHVSRRTGSEPWPVGEPVELCELRSVGSSIRRPTAISADGLTLFFYDPL